MEGYEDKCGQKAALAVSANLESQLRRILGKADDAPLDDFYRLFLDCVARRSLTSCRDLVDVYQIHSGMIPGVPTDVAAYMKFFALHQMFDGCGYSRESHRDTGLVSRLVEAFGR